MKRLSAVLFCLITANSWAAGRTIELIDATKTKVTLVDGPRRIVTLAPSLAEVAADILGSDVDRIVGVSDRTDEPPILAQRPSVGSFVRFSIEKVISLKPDLVLAITDGNPKDSVERLRELKVPVVVVSCGTVAEIKESFVLIGQALGREKVGIKLSDQLQKGIDAIRAKGSGGMRSAGKGPRIALQVGYDPLVVAAQRTFLHEALEIVGAQNAFGDLKLTYPKPSLEEFIKRDPDQIIVLAMDQDLTPYEKAAKRWEEFKQLSAVRKHRISVVRADALVRPSMRLLEGLSLLQKAVSGP